MALKVALGAENPRWPGQLGVFFGTPFGAQDGRCKALSRQNFDFGPLGEPSFFAQTLFQQIFKISRHFGSRSGGPQALGTPILGQLSCSNTTLRASHALTHSSAAVCAQHLELDTLPNIQ